MIRLALIGLGAVTRNLHLPAYEQLGDRVEVVGGCDPDSAAQKWAHGNGIPRVCSDAVELVARTRPDIVSVCTPPGMHFEHVMLALRHGCHVFCEKPLTEDLALADTIIHAAEQAHRLVVVNTQYPMMKIHAAAKRLLGSSEVGRLRYLHASQFLSQPIDSGWRKGTWRRTCCDFTLHILELLRFFFEDDPVRLFAHMPDPAQVGRELVDVISVEFSGGRAASIIVSRMSQGRQEFLTLRLDGEFASIRTSMDTEVCLHVGLYPGKKRGFVRFDHFKGGSAMLERGNRSRRLATEGMNPFVSGTAANLRQFVEAIEAGTEPRFTAKHHRKTLELMLAAYESAASDRWTEFSDSSRVAAGPAGT